MIILITTIVEVSHNPKGIEETLSRRIVEGNKK